MYARIQSQEKSKVQFASQCTTKEKEEVRERKITQTLKHYKRQI